MSTLKVYCDHIEKHPHCIHGPTLLFSRLVKGRERKFFSCSAYRNRKDCSFFMWEDEKLLESKLLAWKHREFESVSIVNHKKISLELGKFKLLPQKERKFCHTCFNFIFPSDIQSHSEHFVANSVSDKLLTFPSLFIKPIVSSKKEAQFWFTENSKHYIVNCLKSVGVSSCICIGVPTLHELLRQTEIKTLLLDIDKRYHYFYDENEFCWFNMFNCHFLANTEVCQKVLKNFLKSETVGLVIDPPFGGRIEPLAKTITLLQQQSASKLKIFLILPYFMESNVVKDFPNFVMLDYQIQYTNHNKFKIKLDVKKKPSPVRIFTNTSPSLLKMPAAEGYYYCKECNCWRSINNRHCELCKTCPSKNGDLYNHCSKCAKCVKQSWNHCNKCGHCVVPGHKCINTNEGKKRAKYSSTCQDRCASRNNKKQKSHFARN